MTPQSAPTQPRRLKIFLCHASDDKPAVRDLYHRLRAVGFDPWLDKEKLLPGQHWDRQIRKAVRSSDAVIICLSHKAVTEAGYIHKEMGYALDVAAEQPEGAIFLIPLRLEECPVPDSISPLHRVDLFHDEGYDRLLGALRTRAKHLGLPTHTFDPDIEPEMILIPAGDFLMGSDPAKDKYASDEEQPQHTLHLPDYCIARTPITNTQYAAFVDATDHDLPQHWERGRPPIGKEDHPAVWISWHDAVAYCNWLAELTGKPYRLPSEPEWEKAARGTDGRIYPWGDEWHSDRCNSAEAGPGDTTSVRAYPAGASPYGLLDMAGNVSEWTRSLWGESREKPDFGYPYHPGDGREDLEAGGDVCRVLPGGAFNLNEWGVRCAYRTWNFPNFRDRNYGFRLCLVPQQD